MKGHLPQPRAPLSAGVRAEGGVGRAFSTLDSSRQRLQPSGNGSGSGWDPAPPRDTHTPPRNLHTRPWTLRILPSPPLPGTCSVPPGTLHSTPGPRAS